MLEAINRLTFLRDIRANELQIAKIKEENHVYRIDCPKGAFFLKTYTKGWYSPDPSKTGRCVDHEASAWRILTAHGLAAPEIVMMDNTCNNPLERPFIVTKELPGNSFTELLKTADNQEFSALCSSVGAYLKRMHAIRFKYPGYLYDDGPTAPPDPAEWQHTTWTYDANKKYSAAFWKNDRDQGLSELVDECLTYIQTQESSLRDSFDDPRFISADCHAHQLFLCKDEGNWNVTGMVDMETSSAGERGGDILKLSLEMAGNFPAKTQWWKSLLDAYDKSYDFGFHKARMLLAGPENYECIPWPGDRRAILGHVLKSDSWEEIFDLQRIVSPTA